jgi:hypothetical protein
VHGRGWLPTVSETSSDAELAANSAAAKIFGFPLQRHLCHGVLYFLHSKKLRILFQSRWRRRGFAKWDKFE